MTRTTTAVGPQVLKTELLAKNPPAKMFTNLMINANLRRNKVKLTAFSGGKGNS
jgi:hypothetical protein